jgi:hypothetical protein
MKDLTPGAYQHVGCPALALIKRLPDGMGAAGLFEVA